MALADDNREILIELVGRSGRNGRVGVLEQRMSAMELVLSEQRKLLYKVILAAVTSGGFGAALGQALLKMFQ